MFLGTVIYDKRHILNLTQSDLASGICNQNTISKMEKHNMNPQLDVLIKICKRLDLSLNDVFSDFSSDSKEEEFIALDDIESDILLSKLEQVNEKISLVKNGIDTKNVAQLDFINCILFFKNSSYDRSSFYADKVLLDTKSDNNNIYTLMSYLIKGVISCYQEYDDMSKYYSGIVKDSLKENFNISNSNSLEILFICKELGESLIKIGEYNESINISKRGIDYANEKHVSYFIDELNYNVALGLKNKSDKSQFDRYKNIAYYSADLLNNKNLLEKIKSTLEL